MTRVLMLVTDGFGCMGGIAQYNRDFLRALDAAPCIENVTVWPRRISSPIAEVIPECVIYERDLAVGKWRFVYRAVREMIFAGPFDLVICAHLHLLPVAWATAKRCRAPVALIIFGIEAWRPTTKRIVNFLADRIDHLISISRFTEVKFVTWARPMITAEIIPPCVDLERFKPGEKPAALIARYGLKGRRVLMSLARLAASEGYKGVDEIIELTPRLVARFPDLVYLVVGEGDDRERLREKAASLGVADRVVFAGKIEEHEKPDHYRLADVFALPSAKEGFGIVLIEAAACGVPVIGGDADGSREALLDGVLGALVSPHDPNGLFDALERALACRASPRRNEAVSFFSTPAFNKRVADWIDKVLQK